MIVVFSLEHFTHQTNDFAVAAVQMTNCSHFVKMFFNGLPTTGTKLLGLEDFTCYIIL